MSPRRTGRVGGRGRIAAFAILLVALMGATLTSGTAYGSAAPPPIGGLKPPPPATKPAPKPPVAKKPPVRKLAATKPACTNNTKAAVHHTYNRNTGDVSVSVSQKLCKVLYYRAAVWVELNPGLGKAHLFPQGLVATTKVYPFQNPFRGSYVVKAPPHGICYTQSDGYAAYGRVPHIPSVLTKGGRGNGEDSYLSTFSTGPGTYTVPNLNNPNCRPPTPPRPVGKFACALNCVGTGVWTIPIKNASIWTEQVGYQLPVLDSAGKPVLKDGKPVVYTSAAVTVKPGKSATIKVPSRNKVALTVLYRYTFSRTWVAGPKQVADCPPLPTFTHSETDTCACNGKASGHHDFRLVPNTLGDGQELRVLNAQNRVVLTVSRSKLAGSVSFSGASNLRVERRTQHANGTWTAWSKVGGHYVTGA
ncbi:MAG TPA: hypothetical protein VMT30_01650 [Candidatus Saccharimonadia bacterium]|nr:hypothetical protein [Candidatus Saccharimonadia bacterium]